MMKWLNAFLIILMYQVTFGECSTEEITLKSLRGKIIKSDSQKYPIKDGYGINTFLYTKEISPQRLVRKEIFQFANDFYVYYMVSVQMTSVAITKVVAKAERITVDGVTNFEIKETIDEQSFIYNNEVLTSCTELIDDLWLYAPCIPQTTHYTFYSTEEGGNNATDGINIYPLISNEELIELNETYGSEFHQYPMKRGYGFYSVQDSYMLSFFEDSSYYYIHNSPDILTYNIRNLTYVTKIYTEGNISRIDIGNLIEENSTVLFNTHLNLFDPNKVYTCAEINEISPEIHDETCVQLFVHFKDVNFYTLSEDDDYVLLHSNRSLEYYPYAPNNEIESILYKNRFKMEYYPIPPECGIYHNLYDANIVKIGYEVFTRTYYVNYNNKTKTTLVYNYERTESIYSSKYTYKSFDEDLSYSTDYDVFELFECPIKNYTCTEMKQQCNGVYEIYCKNKKDTNDANYYFTTVMIENPVLAILFGSDDIFYDIKTIDELSSIIGLIDEEPTTTITTTTTTTTTTIIINDQNFTYSISSDSGIMKKNKIDENNEEIKIYTDSEYIDYKNEKNTENGKSFIVKRTLQMKRIDGQFNSSFALSKLNEEESIINGNDEEKMKDCPSGKYKCSELKENCELLYNSECILRDNEKSSKLFILKEEEGSDVYSLNEDYSINNEDKWEKKSLNELNKILSDLMEDSGCISQISFILITIIILLLLL